MSVLSLIKNMPAGIVRAAGKTMFALKKVKPQIMVGGGIVIATGAFVLAIINARKMDKTIEEGNEKVEALEKARDEFVQKSETTEITEKDKKEQLKAMDRDIQKAKGESMLKMFMLIGIPGLMFAGGIAMTVGGHRILLQRFGQLSASFAALKESYDRYRAANIAEHGEECDRRYRYGIVDECETTARITDENGEERNVKCKVPVVDKENAFGMYHFEFSEHTSRKCPKDPINTISFLKCQEKFWNIRMQTTGKPVTLAMVLDDLGLDLDPDDPRNDYILIAGWRPNGDGDNEIDFGIMRAVNKPAIDAIENVVFLDFNCDGNIYHSTRYNKNGKKVC